MSLKELTANKHAEAESTPFMKAVFARNLPHHLWIDWTYQRSHFYGFIEGAASINSLLDDLPGLPRSFLLYQDFREMNKDHTQYAFRKPVIAYREYLMSIANNPEKIMAHLYTWHMGDMFGGQAIKKIVPGSHKSLEFKDSKTLISNIRAKLDDSMADEANLAFDWAIKIMKDYDSSLESNIPAS